MVGLPFAKNEQHICVAQKNSASDKIIEMTFAQAAQHGNVNTVFDNSVQRVHAHCGYHEFDFAEQFGEAFTVCCHNLFNLLAEYCEYYKRD